MACLGARAQNDGMTFVFAAVAIVLIACVALVAAGRFDRIGDAVPDARPADDNLDPQFDVVIRGYRMDEVDRALAERDAQIAELKERMSG